MRAYAIALDIDGTLEGFGGIINRKSIELMLRHAHVGIVSARSDCEKKSRKISDWGMRVAPDATSLLKLNVLQTML